MLHGRNDAAMQARSLQARPPDAPIMLHMRNTWATFARVAREDLGLTRDELAAALNVERTTVWRWETGKTTPNDQELVLRFAAVAEVNPDEALAAAGLKPGAVPPTEPTRESAMDPDVRTLLHMLADPNVNAATKAYIRRTLQILANLAEGEAIPRTR